MNGKRKGIPTSWLVGGTLLFFSGLLLAGNAPTSTAPAKYAAMSASHPATTASQPATRTAEQQKQDDIERVMEFLRLTQPDVYDQANALKGNDPAKFDSLILRVLPTVSQLESIRQHSPELFELSMRDLELGYQSLRTAHDLKRTDLGDGDRRRMEKLLHETIAAEFDVQQKIRQFEIDDLQGKVKNLDDQVKDREAQKQSIIDKRASELTQGPPRLEW